MGGRWGRATMVLALLGATLGPLLDAIHTHSGTSRYTHPVIFDAAWWVFPLFAATAVVTGLARPVWERVLERRTPAPPHWQVWLGMALFILAYAISGLLPTDWTTRSLLLVVIFGLVWGVSDRTPVGIFLAICAAFLGTSTEIALIHLDLFHYTHPNFSAVPGWLPWLYTTAAIAVGNLGKVLVDR